MSDLFTGTAALAAGTLSRLSLVICTVWVATAASAAAQDGAFQGLFGGAADRPAREKLDVSFTVGEAYDSDTSRALTAIDSGLVPGASTSLSGNAEYRKQGARAEFGITGASAFRYYNGPADFRALGQSVGAGVSTRVGARTKLFVNQSVAYSPSYLYGVFPRLGELDPGEAIPAAPDYVVNDSASTAYSTTASVTHGLSPRNRISVSGEFAYTDFRQESALRRDVTTTGAAAEFTRGVSQNLGVAIGYRYRTGDFGYGQAGTSDEHRVEFGFDLSRPVSSTRSIAASFSVGMGILSTRGAVSPILPADAQHWLASADAALSYPIGRTWTLAAAFRRGTSYLPELTDVIVTNGVSGSIGGMLSSRADFIAGVGYSDGNATLSAAGSQLNTYTVNARLRYGLTRTVAAYAEYLYYYYDFDRALLLTPGLPAGLERNAVRAGLTFWVPAFRR